MNLPNILSFSRIAALPVIAVPLALDTAAACWLALALFIAAAITDFLDGWLARRDDESTVLGTILDPIADKLLVGVVLLVLTGIGRTPDWHLIPAAVIIARELVVSGLREHLAPLSVVIPVSWLAKWKTTVQLIALGLLIVGPHGPGPTWTIGLVALWIAAALTLLTAWEYVAMAINSDDIG